MISTTHFAQNISIPQKICVPFGMSIEEIALYTHECIEHVTAFVRAPSGHTVEWIEIPRHLWRSIRPKVDGVIRFGFRPKGSALKSIFTIVVAIVVAIAAPYLIPVLGTVGAALATVAIGIGASLALNALFPTEKSSQTSTSSSSSVATASQPKERARQYSDVESGSNVLAKEAYLPIVVGTRRISPPEIANPFMFLESGVQSIKRIFALAGHHELSDIEADQTPVEDSEHITATIRDGAETTAITTDITKISKYYSIGETLSTFTVDELELVDQETPSLSEPRWVRFPTIYDKKLEEISLRLQLDSFLKTDSATQAIRIPIRMRFRQKGSSDPWWNLPEIHLIGRDVSTSLKEVRIRWDSNFGELEDIGEITYEFFQRVPPAAFLLSDSSTGDQWQANSQFVLSDATLMSVQNISGRRNGLRIILNETNFPKEEYEWEIIRGICVNSDALNSSTYVLSGAVNSLFISKYVDAKWQIPIDQGSYIGKISPVHVTSIINEQPCQRPCTALIALTSRGQSVKNVTVLASRYVYDWDGSGWNTLTTTSNPATHYRQVLADYLAYHNIDLSLIAEEQFVAWRAECAARGYEVSGVFAGSSVKEVLDAIAVAGYARARYSDGFGIDYFRDRTSERPIQTFSPRNATISVQWVSSEKPVGIRATFSNEEKGYQSDELQINNPFYSNFTGYEVRDYTTISKPSLIKRRALFDMLQTQYQGRRVWQIECAIEGMICERGDLIGVVTDLTDDRNSGTRVREVINTNVFTIDQNIPHESTTEIFSIDNVFEPEDIFSVGEQSLCLVSTPNGTEMRTITALEDNIVRVNEPFSSTDFVGAHIVIGTATQLTRRCIVSDISRLNEERATILCVDEAPEIYRTLFA